jgi:uncharacterized protein (DUF305 family)
MTDHTAHGGGHHADDAFHSGMEASMARMMKDMHSPGYSGDPDRDFLAMMIPHHQGAVDMAKLLLVHGRDPLVRQLAEEIIASQTVEIQAMSARMALLRAGPNPDPGGYPALGSVRGPGN